jgi:hypothetical protein
MEGGVMAETRVKVDLSFTRNLGNVETATERVYAFVENKLIEKTREVEKELKNGK